MKNFSARSNKWTYFSCDPYMPQSFQHKEVTWWRDAIISLNTLLKIDHLNRPVVIEVLWYTLGLVILLILMKLFGV